MSDNEAAESRSLLRDSAAFGLFVVALLLGLSIGSHDPADPPSEYVYPANKAVSNWCGPVGASFSRFAVDLCGIASILVPVTLLAIAKQAWQQRGGAIWARTIVGSVLLIVSIAGLMSPIPGVTWLTPVAGPGGSLGLLVLGGLEYIFSKTGGVVILVSVAVAGGALAFGQFFRNALRWGGIAAGRTVRLAYGGLKFMFGQSEEETAAPVDEDDLPITIPIRRSLETAAMETNEQEDDEEEEAPRKRSEHPRQELKIIRSGANDPPAPKEVEIPVPQVEGYENYTLPPIDVLDESPVVELGDAEDEIRDRASRLEKTFAEFQMRVQVVQIDTGPVVTQYEIELQPGLRVNKVVQMSDDLALALRAPSVRIVAPIPGKNTVGIEVPNERRAKVTLREVITKASGVATKMRLPLFLGKDVKGQPLVYDLANMPHLLIAGRTGTGKSVCLNALILSIVMTRTPEQVKMLMIDPKMVELSLYKDIPHLLHPVVTDMKKAEALLGWAVDKMEERYELLARVGVRHIDSYNKLSREEILERLELEDPADEAMVPSQLSYLLIFADEMADLMMTAAKEVEAHIIRLAQKSRAVGIHLILATQKPTVDVITGLIKSNLPARIAFQVASKSDSRVVLDESGADKLLGNGDMLFLYPGTSKIVRAQGTFVSDEEVGKVTEYLCSQGKPQYSEELIKLDVSDSSSRDADGKVDLSARDDLYLQAIEVVLREQRGSVSLLQRALGVGYGRGARLIDFMAEDGIVGSYNGSQAREVLYTIEQWDELRQNLFGKAG